MKRIMFVMRGRPSFSVCILTLAPLFARRANATEGRRMTPLRAYTFGGALFTIIGIAAIARHDLLPGILVLIVAIGCALRAHNEWKRNRA